MTIAALRKKAQDFLQNIESNIAIDALLKFILQKDDIFLIAYPEFEIAEKLAENFFILLQKFKQGFPLAYLTNKKEFYGFEFYVNENVLIPRPESEMIVELTNKFVQKSELSSPVKVLDIGTGSGNILLSILKSIPESVGLGIDISEPALEVAFQNAQNLGLIEKDRVSFLQNSLLQGFEKNNFDIITANLPYIGTKRYNFVAEDVMAYEPHLALFAGEDGLDLYRQLFEQLASFDWKPKLLLGEFGAGQSELIEQELVKFFPQAKFQILKDYALIDRVFMVDFR